MSYRSVGIPPSRIFTIDPAGDVKLELLPSYKSNYTTLNELVDHIFPPVPMQTGSGILASSTDAHQEGFTDFNYWRAPLPEIDVQFFVDKKPDSAKPTSTYEKDQLIESDEEGYAGGGEDEDLAAYVNG